MWGCIKKGRFSNEVDLNKVRMFNCVVLFFIFISDDVCVVICIYFKDKQFLMRKSLSTIKFCNILFFDIHNVNRTKDQSEFPQIRFFWVNPPNKSISQ